MLNVLFTEIEMAYLIRKATNFILLVCINFFLDMDVLSANEIC